MHPSPVAPGIVRNPWGPILRACRSWRPRRYRGRSPGPLFPWLETPSVAVKIHAPDEDTVNAFAERLGELAADAWFDGAITLPERGC